MMSEDFTFIPIPSNPDEITDEHRAAFNAAIGAVRRARFDALITRLAQEAAQQCVSTAVERGASCNDATADELSDGAATAEHVSKF